MKKIKKATFVYQETWETALNKIFGLKKEIFRKSPYFFQWFKKKSSPTCYFEQNAIKLLSLLMNRANQSVYRQILTNSKIVLKIWLLIPMHEFNSIFKPNTIEINQRIKKIGGLKTLT